MTRSLLLAWTASAYGRYNWNRSLFPDPTAFVYWLHSEKGLELCLNLHSQCGIDKCQHNYMAAAQALGVGPGIGGGCRLPHLRQEVLRDPVQHDS